jgi:hypothetical protein
LFLYSYSPIGPILPPTTYPTYHFVTWLTVSTLKMAAAGSSLTLSTKLHGITSNKTVCFLLIAVETLLSLAAGYQCFIETFCQHFLALVCQVGNWHVAKTVLMANNCSPDSFPSIYNRLKL